MTMGKSATAMGWAVPTKKVNKDGLQSNFFKDKIQYTWALEAKSEFNLGFSSTHRSFWTITQLWGFETRKFNSSTKPSSGRALEALWDQTNIGMTCCYIKVTFNNTKLGGAGFALGSYSLVIKGVGTGEASEARASPEIRAFTIEKF